MINGHYTKFKMKQIMEHCHCNQLIYDFLHYTSKLSTEASTMICHLYFFLLTGKKNIVGNRVILFIQWKSDILGQDKMNIIYVNIREDMQIHENLQSPAGTGSKSVWFYTYHQILQLSAEKSDLYKKRRQVTKGDNSQHCQKV